MIHRNSTGALREYGKIGAHAGVESATPHRLISMLLDGALAKITAATAMLRRGAVGPKAEQLGLALSIVGGLRGSLNLDRGGEIAVNLDNLYEYIERRIVAANLHNDLEALEEVHRLLAEIKAGWEAIGEQVDPTRVAAS